jgi:hypothetical protein
MKKIYFIAALAMATMTANAQERLTISTFNGTNVEKFDGKICDVTVTRYMFNGWNTIALPFDVTADEMNEVFGYDCKLEQLVSVENVGNDVQLNFQDCKEQGMKANTPYILYYTGENSNKKITKEAVVNYAVPALSFRTERGESVMMAGVQTKTDGIGYYGILARDNAEAKFVKVDGTLNGFLATRCYVQLGSETATKLITNHMAAGETTSINAITKAGEKVDVYNMNGQKVGTKMNAAQVNSLRPGVYLVKGQKVLVK